MDLELSRKKVIVTGGTRGIGRSIAECFAKEGCSVAICARNADQVEETVANLKTLGVQATGRAVDVSESEKFKQWIADAADELGGLDIYITNVSAMNDDWEKSCQIDILACVDGVEAALPFLKKSEAGAIVAISSIAGVLSTSSLKPYSAVKAALINYMSTLSRELAPQGIRVNTVSPGSIYFKGGIWNLIEQHRPEMFEQALKRNIMGRLGKPEEVAKAAVFLASPAASFISGTNLLVDGASTEYVQF